MGQDEGEDNVLLLKKALWTLQSGGALGVPVRSAGEDTQSGHQDRGDAREVVQRPVGDA